MTILQEFECCITDVFDDDTIGIMIMDLTDDTNPDEYAVISKNKFTKDQQQYLKLGYIFTWVIKAVDANNAISSFIFKPLEIFTQDDIDRAAQHAKELSAMLLFGEEE